jgi:hypothetical protein
MKGKKNDGRMESPEKNEKNVQENVYKRNRALVCIGLEMDLVSSVFYNRGFAANPETGCKITFAQRVSSYPM